MEFSKQEHWSWLPFPSLGDLPDPGIEPRSPTLQADSLPSEPSGKPTTEAPPLRKTSRQPFCLKEAAQIQYKVVLDTSWL